MRLRPGPPRRAGAWPLGPWLTLPGSGVSCCSVQHQVLASRTGQARQVRGHVMVEGASIQPPSWLGVGPKGGCGSSGWTGGWAWKGPGHPVDNGDQTRCQRDGLRSEGAARVLFLCRCPGEAALVKLAGRSWQGEPGRANLAGTNPGASSLFSEDRRSARAAGRGRARSGLAKSGLAGAADIMACTVGISFHDQHRLFTNRNDRQGS